MPARQNITLLLVEDHHAFREMLAESLETLGYQVCAFDSAETALESDAALDAEIALLDLNLPGEDGLFLAEQLRVKSPKMGIIMLTVRNAIADKLAGYEIGADLYLSKPVGPEELDAAIQALCRRINLSHTVDLTLHHDRCEVCNQNQTCVVLTDEEATLLTALALAPHCKLKFWQLAEKLELDLDSDTLRTNLEKRISRLRQKLMQLEQPASAIKAIRNHGYKLTLSVHLA